MHEAPAVDADKLMGARSRRQSGRSRAADLERDVLSAAIASQIDCDVQCRTIELDGAARAATAISALV